VTTAWSRPLALARPSAVPSTLSATTGGRHATATGQSTSLDNISRRCWEHGPVESPTHAEERFRRHAARCAVRGQRCSVVRFRPHPHAVAAALASEIGQRADERPAYAAIPLARVDRQFIQEHLRALVRVGGLHAGNEADRLVLLHGDQQVVAPARQERRRPRLGRRSIEEVGGGEHDLLVAWSHAHDPHRRIVWAARPVYEVSRAHEALGRRLRRRLCPCGPTVAVPRARDRDRLAGRLALLTPTRAHSPPAVHHGRGARPPRRRRGRAPGGRGAAGGGARPGTSG
jgi:hypothetical protein